MVLQWFGRVLVVFCWCLFDAWPYSKAKPIWGYVIWVEWYQVVNKSQNLTFGLGSFEGFYFCGLKGPMHVVCLECFVVLRSKTGKQTSNAVDVEILKGHKSSVS